MSLKTFPELEHKGKTFCKVFNLHAWTCWLHQEQLTGLNECFIKTVPTTLLEEIVPKEAWVYMLSYELMKGIQGDIWGPNQKLMRKSTGVRSSRWREKEGRGKTENCISFPLMWIFCFYAMLPS